MDESDLLARFLFLEPQINKFWVEKKPLLIKPLQQAGFPITDISDIPTITYEANRDNFSQAIGSTDPNWYQFTQQVEQTCFGPSIKGIILNPQVFLELLTRDRPTAFQHTEDQTTKLLIHSAIALGIDALMTTLTGNPDDDRLRDKIFSQFMMAIKP